MVEDNAVEDNAVEDDAVEHRSEEKLNVFQVTHAYKECNCGFEF